MRIDVLTILPGLLEGPFSDSIMKRAQDKGLAEIHIHNIRDYSTNKHKNVDDYQYGGGAGMVMSIEPIATLIDKLKSERTYDEIIYMTPDGELLEQNMMKNAARQGERLIKGLFELQKTYECMGDVRGKGLMAAVELVKDRETKEPATDWKNRIIKNAFEKGLLLLGCGENSIRFSPSLTVTPAEVDVCLSIFEEAVKNVTG